jgi:hypothetical protein
MFAVGTGVGAAVGRAVGLVVGAGVGEGSGRGVALDSADALTDAFGESLASSEGLASKGADTLGSTLCVAPAGDPGRMRMATAITATASRPAAYPSHVRMPRRGGVGSGVAESVTRALPRRARGQYPLRNPCVKSDASIDGYGAPMPYC